MINGYKKVQWTTKKPLWYLGFSIKFIINFPLHSFLYRINCHKYSWVAVFGQSWSPGSPFEGVILKVKDVSVVQVVCYWVTGDEAFLKLFSLDGESNDDTVTGGENDFEADFALCVGRERVLASDGVPGVFGGDFEQGVSIHFEHGRVHMEATEFDYGFFGEFWLNNCIIIFLLNFSISLLNPLKQILLVGNKLQNTSVLTKILKRLITLDAFPFYMGLLLFTARLTNGMLAFTNHDGYALMLVIGVLTHDTSECGVVHKHDIVNGVIFVGFRFYYVLSGLEGKYFRRDWFYFRRSVSCLLFCDNYFLSL